MTVHICFLMPLVAHQTHFFSSWFQEIQLQHLHVFLQRTRLTDAAEIDLHLGWRASNTKDRNVQIQFINLSPDRRAAAVFHLTAGWTAAMSNRLGNRDAPTSWSQEDLRVCGPTGFTFQPPRRRQIAPLSLFGNKRVAKVAGFLLALSQRRLLVTAEMESSELWPRLKMENKFYVDWRVFSLTFAASLSAHVPVKWWQTAENKNSVNIHPLD